MEWKRDILNVAIIALLFLSVSFISQRSYPTEGGFAALYKVWEARNGNSESFFYSASAFIQRELYYCQIHNCNEIKATPRGDVEQEYPAHADDMWFFAAFAVLAGVIAAAAFYFALSLWGLEKNSALFGGILFSTSPAFLFSFMPHYYAQGTLALCIGAIALLLFSLAKRGKIYAVASALLFALASLIFPAFSLVGIAFGIALGVEGMKKKGKELGTLVVPAIFLLPSLAILALNTGEISFSLSTFGNSLFDVKFLLCLGAVCLAPLARKFEGEGEAFFALVFFFGLIMCFVDSSAALAPLSFAAAKGIEVLLKNEKKEREERIALYASFFFFLMLGFAGFSDAAHSIVLSGVFSALVCGVLYVYKFNAKSLPHLIVCALVLSSSVGGITVPSAASAQGNALNFGGRELGGAAQEEYDAYVWIAKSEIMRTGGTLAVMGNGAAAKYLTLANVEENERALADFLAGNESAQVLRDAEIDYVVVSAGIFDEPQKIREISGKLFRVESFYYIANVSTGNTRAMLFRSSSGAFLQRPLDTDGKLTITDSAYFNGGGAFVSLVPYSNILALDGKLPYDDAKNRMVWVQGIYNTNAFGIFFDKVEGLEEVYSNAQVKVLMVK
ncbi:hypothetical protein AUJ17_04860 [Candidatus Micrarchaeota archaeon CG1_02_47_40]|nr:MAG: hypothetical protein AUJ17_04860 [Candidatus Micrarchaeota archaeon CG1_02_47_40]